MQQILVVANQTAVGAHLTQRLYELKDADASMGVHVVVPATPRNPKGLPRVDVEGRTVHDADGVEQAGRQLRSAMRSIEKLGVDVTGSVGPADPMRAVDAAMEDRRVDRILVSTLPVGASRWLAMDLPHRLSRRYKVPVDHVVGKPTSEGGPRTPVEGSLTVLLVEDQPADVALTRRALEQSDIEVDLRVAKNGAEALEALRTYGTNGIDLVLLDLNMPVLDGHQFLEQASAEVDLDDLNVAILTTSTNETDQERAHALSASAYLIKDPDFDVFADIIGSVLAEVAAG